jgi:hypothetical protein
MPKLSEIGKAARAQAAMDALTTLLECDTITSLVPDLQEGTVTDEEGHTFTYANGGLALLGFCPKCSQEVPSRRIRSAADLGDLFNNFRAAQHDCMDID